MKKTTIKDISTYLILRFQLEGIPLSPLKLQKLLYYIQAWHLVFFDKNQLFDDLPEAWVNGPVYRNIYVSHVPTYQMNDVIKQDVSYESLQILLKETYEKLALTPQQNEYLEAIIKKYGYMTAEQLVYLTHVEQPWNDARAGLGLFDRSNNTISADAMYSYYQAKRKTVPKT